MTLAYCVDDPDNSMTNGTKLQLWQCNGKPQQNLTTISEGNGYYELVFQNGKCVDDTGNSTMNGTLVQIWTCLGDAAQA